jgi:hypothetical protein
MSHGRVTHTLTFSISVTYTYTHTHTHTHTHTRTYTHTQPTPLPQHLCCAGYADGRVKLFPFPATHADTHTHRDGKEMHIHTDTRTHTGRRGGGAVGGVTVLGGHSGGIPVVRFSGDGRRVLTAGDQDCTVMQWVLGG